MAFFPAKLRCEKGLNELPGIGDADNLTTETDHIEVIVFDALAALVSVPTLVYLAWFFGDNIDHVVKWAKRSEYGILVLVGIAVLFIGLKLYRKRRAGPSAAAE